MTREERLHAGYVARLAARHGGDVLLTSRYLGQREDCQYRCNRRHRWTDSPKRALIYGCPRCTGPARSAARKARTARKYGTTEYRLGRRVVEVQGFEPQALDFLIREWGVKPGQIRVDLSDELPVIEYRYRRRRCRHYPDIWIRDWNHIIEVKSSYTLRTRGGNVRRAILAKASAARAAGYEYTILVMRRDGSLEEAIGG